MITCPQCQTTYTPERLGLTDLLLRDNVQLAVDVKCPVCGVILHAEVQQATTMQRLLRHPWRKTKTVSHNVVVSPQWIDPNTKVNA